MIRFISFLIRKIHEKKDSKKGLLFFEQWEKVQFNLPVFNKKEKKLLLIRLDDIGDYILFRNSLHAYKTSLKWKEYKITLLGNVAWKELFDFLDAATVDEVLWVNKKEYLRDSLYRLNLWTELRNKQFEIVISPSHTRPVLLDDICMLAANPSKSIGAENTSIHEAWNELSDKLYTDIYKLRSEPIHEFFFNQNFAAWCCGIQPLLTRPEIPVLITQKKSYLLCFIGSSTKSKSWPAKNWKEFIILYKEKWNYKILISGAEADIDMATSICSETQSTNIAGKTSLADLIGITANAAAVITHDTMMAHLGVSCNVFTIIIANGINAYRFTDYEKAGIKNVHTIYPEVFLKKRKKGISSTQNYTAVTSDIASISAKRVFNTLKEKINSE